MDSEELKSRLQHLANKISPDFDNPLTVPYLRGMEKGLAALERTVAGMGNKLYPPSLKAQYEAATDPKRKARLKVQLENNKTLN